MAEGVNQDGEPSVSPRSEHLGEADHVIHDPRDYDDADVADRASAEISKRDPRVASTTETQSSNLRRRIKTVARISQEFSSNVARISSQLERLLHLFFWTDPRLSTLFVSCCLACALVLLVVPPNYVAILCGLYLMRPPQFRDAEDGLATTLWSRLPDNSDAF